LYCKSWKRESATKRENDPMEQNRLRPWLATVLGLVALVSAAITMAAPRKSTRDRVATGEQPVAPFGHDETDVLSVSVLASTPPAGAKPTTEDHIRAEAAVHAAFQGALVGDMSGCIAIDHSIDLGVTVRRDGKLGVTNPLPRCVQSRLRGLRLANDHLYGWSFRVRLLRSRAP
jgi:hypothetical protein